MVVPALSAPAWWADTYPSACPDLDGQVEEGILPPILPSAFHAAPPGLQPLPWADATWSDATPCSPVAAGAAIAAEAAMRNVSGYWPNPAPASPQNQDATREHLLCGPWRAPPAFSMPCGQPAMGEVPATAMHPPPPPAAPAPAPVHAWVLESKLAAESVRAEQQRWAEQMRLSFVGAEATEPARDAPCTPKRNMENPKNTQTSVCEKLGLGIVQDLATPAKPSASQAGVGLGPTPPKENRKPMLQSLVHSPSGQNKLGREGRGMKK
mmetsp:Transcript_78050/g.137517  ORF Transcript_78050/g.137517 Transcript_78050/m.137517 type:complete len:267 (+) Transcript_78050:112-912(+)